MVSVYDHVDSVTPPRSFKSCSQLGVPPQQLYRLRKLRFSTVCCLVNQFGARRLARVTVCARRHEFETRRGRIKSLKIGQAERRVGGLGRSGRRKETSLCIWRALRCRLASGCKTLASQQACLDGQFVKPLCTALLCKLNRKRPQSPRFGPALEKSARRTASSVCSLCCHRTQSQRWPRARADSLPSSNKSPYGATPGRGPKKPSSRHKSTGGIF